MKVRELMTKDPLACTPETGLRDVAKMMCEGDCGEIPVVESKTSAKPVGVITDRDITCRAVARGRNPLELTAADCMSSPAVTVTPETSLEDCCKVLEKHQIRRVPVVDKQGRCCGMVAQADIARRGPAEATCEIVKEVSQPVAA
ncbi:MAG: CBS domain-containing protein [Elusimicrobia bacterium]|nr:CBS domain-containing protein [Elusimicrobiota bacterium]